MGRWRREQLRELSQAGAKPHITATGEIVLRNPPADLDVLETSVNLNWRSMLNKRAKDLLEDDLGTLIKAVVLTLVDAINIERASRPNVAPITPNQIAQQIRNKIDTLL